jgi:hypothetical protein
MDRGGGLELGNVDLAEMACEPNVLFGRERLLADEEQHEIVEQRIAHRGDAGLIERLRQVDVADPRADPGSHLFDLHDPRPPLPSRG